MPANTAPPCRPNRWKARTAKHCTPARTAASPTARPRRNTRHNCGWAAVFAVQAAFCATASAPPTRFCSPNLTAPPNKVPSAAAKYSPTPAAPFAACAFRSAGCPCPTAAPSAHQSAHSWQSCRNSSAKSATRGGYAAEAAKQTRCSNRRTCPRSACRRKSPAETATAKCPNPTSRQPLPFRCAAAKAACTMLVENAHNVSQYPCAKQKYRI